MTTLVTPNVATPNLATRNLVNTTDAARPLTSSRSLFSLVCSAGCYSAPPMLAVKGFRPSGGRPRIHASTNLPTPTPTPPAIRVVQLVNCSNQTLLGAANAAGSVGQPLTSVFPREGTWVMGPAGAPNHGNILTLDIPPAWAATIAKGSVAPNIWARTGCRYDIAADKAQCETGGAGGVYDVSKAHLGPPGATTITEWTFYQQSMSTTGGTYFKDNFDISAVNGASLTVDIQEVGGSPEDPGAPQNVFWLTNSRVTPPNYPMSVHGDDLRADDRCPAPFRLKRADLTTNGTFGKIYGFVILDDNGQPQGGDGTIACFSNCGKYKFPTEPAMDLRHLRSHLLQLEDLLRWRPQPVLPNQQDGVYERRRLPREWRMLDQSR